MKHNSFLLAAYLMLGTLSATGQSYDCGSNPLGHYQVSAPEGALLLTDWTEDALVITRIPYKTVLTVCEDARYVTSSDDTLIRAFFADTSGFVRVAFLTRQEPIQVAILSRWMAKGFPPAKTYYGLFYREQEDSQLSSSLERCETRMDSFVVDPWPSEAPAHAATVLAQPEKPRILLSGLPLSPGTANKGMFFDARFLYPGESILWQYDGDHAYLIYATGEVEKSQDSTRIDALSGIRNYTLHIRRQLNGTLEDRILYDTAFDTFNSYQYRGGIHLHWIGDLDGDQQLDMILTVSHHHACWDVVLWLSSGAEPGYFLKEAAKYGDCSC
ncbi:MAG: hypothetical protein SF053_12800 [Bacteroidia bacterium]|nr:hypothetical protein [Bacteroidia bacterium]